MNRRRADTAHPYPGIAPEDLTGGQRRDVQAVFVERYHGRKDREAWDRRYWRGRQGQIFVRPRVVRVPTGSARGSSVWRK